MRLQSVGVNQGGACPDLATCSCSSAVNTFTHHSINPSHITRLRFRLIPFFCTMSPMLNNSRRKFRGSQPLIRFLPSFLIRPDLSVSFNQSFVQMQGECLPTGKEKNTIELEVPITQSLTCPWVHYRTEKEQGPTGILQTSRVGIASLRIA